MDVDLEGDANDTVREMFTYDGLNRLVTANKSVWYDGSPTETKISEITTDYTDLGAVAAFDQKLFGEATAKHIGYTHDQAGFVTSTTYPSGMVIDRTNTSAGQIDTLSQAGTVLVDYAYVGSRPAGRGYPAINVATGYAYDNLGRVTAIDAGVERVKFSYTYHPNTNNIAAKTFHHRNPVVANSYAYDALDRLTDVEYLGHPLDVEAFPMDDLGNRVGSVTQRDGVHTYSVDALTNRYTQIESAAIGHDDAGNLVRDRQGYRYQYDYENRIVRIYRLSGPTEVTVATFDYDALGRRVRKVDAIAGTTTLYYYDPEWRCLEERDGEGALEALYVYGNYIDEVLLMDRLGAEYYTLHDHLHSAAALLDWSGAVVERYEYDAYGTVHVFDGSWNPRTASAYGNPYTFTGRRLDVLDAGNLKLMYYRHRYYEPYVGRFLQHDPRGIRTLRQQARSVRPIIQYADGLSLYQYVRSQPVFLADPTGLGGATGSWGCTFQLYKNKGWGGHRGILVNGADYDFGPNHPNPFGGYKGICPWGYGGPDDNAQKITLREKVTGWLYGHFRKGTGKRIKPCTCAVCDDIVACIKAMCVYYNTQGYQYGVTDCRSFVRDVLKACCLER